jgi:chemotaxis protein methyltransferase CheR
MPIIGIVETRNLIRAIYQKYGYYFSHYALTAFRLVLDRSIQLHHMKYPELLVTRILEDDDFFDEFLFEIADSSLELFRDPETWNSLKSEILPDYFDTFHHPKIWFPAAYNGQDLFSLLIMLKVAFPEKSLSAELSCLSEKTLRIISRGDIFTKQLESGIENFEKVLPSSNIYSFMKPNGKDQIFDYSPFEKVHFKKQNLIFERCPQNTSMIFFRNILLNYNHENMFKILDRITSSLEPGGYLLIGIKESIDEYISARHSFKVINKKEKIYKKI